MDKFDFTWQAFQKAKFDWSLYVALRLHISQDTNKIIFTELQNMGWSLINDSREIFRNYSD